jgi:hypothetical protein
LTPAVLLLEGPQDHAGLLCVVVQALEADGLMLLLQLLPLVLPLLLVPTKNQQQEEHIRHHSSHLHHHLLLLRCFQAPLVPLLLLPPLQILLRPS